jgi:predicted flap endonuclease-1-like 5' DNA nuclease
MCRDFQARERQKMQEPESAVLRFVHSRRTAPMVTAVKDLAGVTDAIVSRLAEKGVKDNEKLLEVAAGPTQRKELAAACGCTTKDILELANRADLARIKGVSGVYSDLLEEAGVDTVKELATRRPDNLYAKITETNDAKKLSERPPTAAMVEDWVKQAKDLPKVLTY